MRLRHAACVAFVASSAAWPFLPAKPTPGKRFFPNDPLDGRTIHEPEAVWALDHYRVVDVKVPEVGVTVPSTFIRPKPSSGRKPVLLFLHGADSSCLEWRYVQQILNESMDCVALDWYSGGWTSREQLTACLQKDKNIQPWTLVRQHIHAFWKQHLDGRPLYLVGTSLCVSKARAVLHSLSLSNADVPCCGFRSQRRSRSHRFCDLISSCGTLCL